MMPSIYDGLMKGVFLTFFICGMSILLFSLIRWLYKITQTSSRWKKLYKKKDQEDTFNFDDLPIVKDFANLLEFAEVKIKPAVMLFIVLLLGLGSYWSFGAGIEILKQSVAITSVVNDRSGIVLINIAMSLLMASLPYFYVVFQAQRKRHRIALRMIVLVQNLIGNYNPHLTISEVISRSANTMPDEVKSEWHRLDLSLHMKPIDEALHDFSNRLRNRWAEQLVDTLLIGAQYGADITDSLHQMVKRMQTSKRNEEKRIAMVTVYRIGTLIMVFFNIGFIAMNIYADSSNYEVYFVSPTGKALVVLSIIVLFVSLILVVRSGRRQF
ncbi:type II secretion system F family protein [Paenibacillus sp. GXUN7292]|uniref:type II secretion system F family protein n=1 Tax=Paenibacillus sp. GXUN7292 TaxID=3422499 RepID=UPI003D7E0609